MKNDSPDKKPEFKPRPVEWELRDGVLHLSHELDLHSCPLLIPGLTEAEAVAKKQGHITLDLTHLSYIDSAGMALFVTFKKSLGVSVPITMIVPPGQVRKMLRLAAFDKLFTVVDPTAKDLLA